MLDPKLMILETQERAGYDDRGQPTIQVRIMWRYGTRHGPFYEYMPKDDFTIDAFQQRIARHTRELALLPD